MEGRDIPHIIENRIAQFAASLPQDQTQRDRLIQRYSSIKGYEFLDPKSKLHRLFLTKLSKSNKDKGASQMEQERTVRMEGNLEQLSVGGFCEIVKQNMSEGLAPYSPLENEVYQQEFTLSIDNNLHQKCTKILHEIKLSELERTCVRKVVAAKNDKPIQKINQFAKEMRVQEDGSLGSWGGRKYEGLGVRNSGVYNLSTGAEPDILPEFLLSKYGKKEELMPLCPSNPIKQRLCDKFFEITLFFKELLKKADSIYKMKSSKQPSYQGYQKLRGQTVLTPPLQAYFKILQSIIEGSYSPQNEYFSLKLFKAFSYLNKNEQIRYALENLEFVRHANHQNQEPSKMQSREGPILVQAACNTSTSNPFKFFCAPQLIFKLDTLKEAVTISGVGRNMQIDLHNYLVSREKKKKIKLIPISVSEDETKGKKVLELIFKQSIATQIFEEAFKIIMRLRNSELLILFSDNDIGRIHRKRSGKGSDYQVLLSHKKLKEFMKFKSETYKTVKTSSKRFQSLKSWKSNKFKQIQVGQNEKNPGLFQLKALCLQPAQNLTLNLKKALDYKKYSQKSRLIEQFQLLQQSRARFQAVYQKYCFDGVIQQMICIKEVPQYRQYRNSGQEGEFLFIKGIQNIIMTNFLCFLFGKVLSISSQECEMIIYAQFNMSQQVSSQLILSYLEDLCQILSNEEESQQNLEEQEIKNSNHSFCKSSRSQEQMDQKQIILEFGDPSDECKDLAMIMEQSDRESEGIRRFTNQNFQMRPLPNYILKQHLIEEQSLFKEWKRQKNGGVICLNEELLKEHKKIFKYIITSIGSNILKGNNVLNVSLPVTIFKKESHLQMLASSFSLAPRLLEGVTHPLERIKFAVLLMISVGNLGISIEKPFYPHLGETLQVWIGGCPMYLEQISRYPPTGSYLLYGRGFRIHGQVEPKIGFGLNSGKGYNERPSYIIFDDGTQIQVSYGKMIINGLFFGEREFNFEEKMFAYDKKNNFFAEVNYGPRDKRILSKDEQPRDFLYGNIYQVANNFQIKFQKQIPRAYPKEKHNSRVLSSFQGIWNGVVSFDGEPYFDFSKELPCEVVPESFPLPSDCRYRRDLRELIKGNMEQAQRQKTSIEEAQRYDRKLRKKFQAS